MTAYAAMSELLCRSMQSLRQQNPPDACAAGILLDQQLLIFCTPDGCYLEHKGQVPAGCSAVLALRRFLSVVPVLHSVTALAAHRGCSCI